jgi:hypothetical protein
MYRFARFPGFCGVPSDSVDGGVVLEILNGIVERKVGV